MTATTTREQADATTVATAYLQLWNLTDAERPDAVRAVFTDDARYVDPFVDVNGPARIERYIAITRRRFADARFALAGEVRAHHGQACFSWSATPPGSADPVASGTDFAQLAGGRIVALHGFFDPPTAGIGRGPDTGPVPAPSHPDDGGIR